MEEFYVEKCCADPTVTINNVLDVVKKKQLSDINKGRRPYGEYHYLFPLLKQCNKKFEGYMRMKLSTFEYIFSKVSDTLVKNWCNLHKQPIKPKEKLVVTIRFLATGASYSDLSYSFLMGKSTVCYLVHDVLEALWCLLAPLHMPIPTADSFFDIAQDFYLLWDIPHCIGAIDVRHIRIKKPSHSGSLYYNYKKFFSITLQATVDAHYRFICIDVGGYGHQHDATTFRHSTLYKALKAKTIKLPQDDELYYSKMALPYFFIGDGAYPLSNNLIKPYPGKKLSEHQKIFNKRLSRARMSVECAFGRLCQKFRIFYTTMEHPPKTAELIVKAACILQNVIINLQQLSSVPSASVILDDEQDAAETLTGDGQTVRLKLTKFFLKNPVNKKETLKLLVQNTSVLT